MAGGIWGRRKREQEELQAKIAELGRRADSALVAADERLRTTADELLYAEIELGRDATSELRAAVAAVREHLGEAFHLNQLNHDEIPDTTEELRTRNERIIQLCDWAQELLDDRTEALAEPIARARRAPEIIAGIRRDVERLSARLPQAEETVARLQQRYSPAALRKISGNPVEARQLLEFAIHGSDVSEVRRESGQREQANIALETAIEAVRRATTLLESVDQFEVEALRAASTLTAIVDDSRQDIVDARDLAGVPAVAAATTALEKALDAFSTTADKPDPFTELTRLREANTALDLAVAKARERAARPVPPESHVRHAIDDADRQLGVARSVISGHRGWIGADARTRLAEAERIRLELAPFIGAPIHEDLREQALADARRCGMLAAEALQLAQRDIDSSRPNDGGWGQSGGRGQRGGPDIMGGLLGGLVIGSLLDGMFD
ncbi:hypothetical protein FVP74_04645 [Microbacterium saccharophilum]|uniref:TPM domain-containing protein n=1 Tax=Microbacterium saccharophilum TaxID=1213358 RepID=A0A5C8I8C6_9MICO|nr:MULTISPECIES: hypothetical protein [Microbacterium]TXK15676.1 hypothetical protein FVP74_04645 [Microbacterium saccharophilum]GEP47987.1 hypothetical protein MSA03_14950 [Microbacterium saccharophilum]SFI63683.1 hypothetical protein SAMN04487751_2419 [Microbacterium saccharophilum]